MKLACERHFRDLARGPSRGLVWRPDLALHRIRFFGFLHHSKGEWGGQILVLAPWQQFVVGSVYGWLRADGTRRFRTVYEEIPRKNGKSTKLAGIGIGALVGDKEPGAEVYAAATRRDQARIVFDEAKRMVRASPQLRSMIGMYQLNMSIDRTASKFEPLSADDKTLDGLNPHCVIIDELHKHRSRAVLDVLDTAMGARRQPLLWIITTAGDDMPETVYAQENDYAIRVLERVVHEADSDSHFVYIATVDKGDRWDDQKTWIKANPNWNVSVKPDDMRRQAAKAKNSPGAMVEFMRMRLNVRTAAAGRFIDMDVWDRNTLCPLSRAVQHRAVVEERLRNRRFYGALDLSSKIDISAWVKLFPPESPAERWVVLGRFWVPQDTVVAKTDRDQVQYQRWINEGWVDATPGNVIDQNAIRDVVIEDCRGWEPISIAFDPWNATQLALGLQDEGLPVVEFIQGIKSYTAPTKELESLLLRHVMDHGSNPVLRWMAANLAVQRDKNENMMPTKQHSRGRIDGMTALIMCIGRSLLADQLGDPTSFLSNPIAI